MNVEEGNESEIKAAMIEEHPSANEANLLPKEPLSISPQEHQPESINTSPIHEGKEKIQDESEKTNDKPVVEIDVILTEVRRVLGEAKFVRTSEPITSKSRAYEAWDSANRVSLGIYDKHDAVIHRNKKFTNSPPFSYSLVAAYYIISEKSTKKEFVAVGIGDHDSVHHTYPVLLREVTLQGDKYVPNMSLPLVDRNLVFLENDVTDLKLIHESDYPEFRSDLITGVRDTTLCDNNKKRSYSRKKEAAPTKLARERKLKQEKPKPDKPKKAQPTRTPRTTKQPTSKVDEKLLILDNFSTSDEEMLVDQAEAPQKTLKRRNLAIVPSDVEERLTFANSGEMNVPMANPNPKFSELERLKEQNRLLLQENYQLKHLNPLSLTEASPSPLSLASHSPKLHTQLFPVVESLSPVSPITSYAPSSQTDNTSGWDVARAIEIQRHHEETMRFLDRSRPK